MSWYNIVFKQGNPDDITNDGFPQIFYALQNKKGIW